MAEQTGTLLPDLNLIRPYSKEDNQIARPTAITHFTDGHHNLYYINASHIMGTRNPLETPTCKIIAQAITRYKPKFLILESLPTDQGTSPRITVERARRAINEAGKENTNITETDYAIFLADKDKIPFAGGEPPNPVVFKEMDANGYSTKDIMAFCLLRYITQERARGKMQDEMQFAQEAEQYLKNSPNFSHIPESERLKVEEFKAWYNKHKTGNKSYLETASNDFAPFADQGATYFQRMSYVNAMIRDRNNINAISNALNNYGDVLVVYGGAHLVQSRPVFEQMFGGQGTTLQLVPNNGKTENPPKKTPMFLKVGATLLGVATVIASGFAADKFLNGGKISRKISESAKGWMER